MGKLTQDGRVGELTTPLGQDVLVLTRFSGTEGLGELFEYNVEALSEENNIDFSKALGQACTLKLLAYKGKKRFFNGVLTRAQWAGKTDDFFRYRLVLRPWFYLLGYKANCRIFLDKKVKDIIEQVFNDAGFPDFDFRLQGSYDVIHYCVQYRETDLAFCTRLMEEYGIYFFFEHIDGKHTMVLADSIGSHKENKDVPKLPYLPLSGTELHEDQLLGAWVSERRFRTGKVEFNDYDYFNPGKDLHARSEGSETYQHSKLEVYDYPGKYDDQSKGVDLSKFRLQAEQSFDHRRYVDGDAASLFPGTKFTVERHPIDSENGAYLVVRCSHSYGTQHYRTGTGGGGPEQEVYYGNYEFQPFDKQFRMLPVTPKPRIYGVQTAKVVGKKGEESEEISTDENGHIWVQFFWDREPKKSCPIRVAHAWSGKKWGTQFIPRIGMEVVVDFLEGDPDRPLVTGCVYNGDNHFPYDLPDKKTQSGTKSDSTKGHHGFNEFRFEDKKGSEDIYMHAQKDHDVVINNNQTGSVGRVDDPDSPYKGGDQSWIVGGDRNWKIQKGDDNLEIEMGDQNIKIMMGDQNTMLGMGDQNTSLLMGSQSHSLALGDQNNLLSVGSQSTMAMLSINQESMMINVTGNVMVTVTAPIINLNGLVLINGMIPMTIPIPV